jgi:hypothetical protein
MLLVGKAHPTSKEGELEAETDRAASGSSPMMTAVVKKRVGNKSVQKASYSSRKMASRISRVCRGPKNPEENGLVSFGKSSEK